MRAVRFCIFLFTTVSVAVAGGKELTVQDIWGSMQFTGKSVRGIQWMKDGRSYSFQETDTLTKSIAIYVSDVRSRSKKFVTSGARLKIQETDSSFSFSSYQWSPDEKQILFVARPPSRQYLSRLTPAGNLFLFDLPSNRFSQLTDVSVPQYNQKFSPNGKMIGFVRGNNLFILDIASKEVRQLTYDGNENIINGKFDWVYEEEFGISDGWIWSPDGLTVAFWQFDQTRVPEYTMTEWDSTHLSHVTMKYPKPGDKNSVVRIGIITVADGTIRWLDIGAGDDFYIPRMQWSREKHVLSYQRLNRAQNTLELILHDLSNNTSGTVITEQSDTWIEVHDDLRFLKNGDIIWSSERDGYNHLYRFDSKGKMKGQITKGQWDVDALYGLDEKKGVMYFTSSEVSPTERHLYSVSMDGKEKKRLTNRSGTHSALFSPTFEQYIGYFSNSQEPTRSALCSNSGKELYTLDDSGISALRQYDLPATEYFTFKTSDGVDLYASMIRPVGFDSTKKYPVLVFTYGGPGSQVVKNAWGGSNYLWHSMLTQKGYVIFMVDNRGTGARGSAFKKITHRNLGAWEVHDQIEGAKYLLTLSFVDKERIGIWGWSYGGYMASHTILIGADYFKAAIAVAPVTHWKFYDTIYTERFMGTPENNPAGYRESAPINHAEKLKGKYLLIHGTSDDNVHFQNAVNMVSALQKANKQFQTMFYPNKNHGISGGKTRVQLYTLMTNFLLENL